MHNPNLPNQNECIRPKMLKAITRAAIGLYAEVLGVPLVQQQQHVAVARLPRLPRLAVPGARAGLPPAVAAGQRLARVDLVAAAVAAVATGTAGVAFAGPLAGGAVAVRAAAVVVRRRWTAGRAVWLRQRLPDYGQ